MATESTAERSCSMPGAHGSRDDDRPSQISARFRPWENDKFLYCVLQVIGAFCWLEQEVEAAILWRAKDLRGICL